MKNLIIRYILKRLLETSTVRGLVLSVGSVIGYHFSDTQTNDIVYIILGIAGLIGTLLPDSLGKTIQESVDEQAPVVEKPQEDKPEEPTSGWGDR